MRKKFFLLQTISIFYFSSIAYSMEQKEIQLGHAIFSCQATKSQLLQKLITQQNPEQKPKLIIPSCENPNKAALQIDSGGELCIGHDINQLIVKSQNGNVKINRSNIKQTNSESLDEEINIKEQANKLHAGENITVVFHDDSRIHITFDRLITLVDKTDNSQHKIRLSQLSHSQFISKAIENNPQEKKEEIKIKLESKIKTFLDFIVANEEERKKILDNLSILKYTKLIADFDFTLFPNEYFSIYRNNLIKRIYNSLKQKDLSWLQELALLPKEQKQKLQAVMGEILNNTIRPNCKVILKRRGVDKAEFSPDGTKVLIHSLDDTLDTKEIINLITKVTLLEKNNVKSIKFSPDSTKVRITYVNNQEEIVDLITNNTLFKESAIQEIQFSPDSTKAIITYFDYTSKIIDLVNGNILFEKSNVKIMAFGFDSTQLCVTYNDNNRGEVINLTTNIVLFKECNINSMQLCSNKMQVTVQYKDNKNKIKVINLATDNILEIYNVSKMELSPDSTKIWIQYHKGKETKVLDLFTQQTLLTKNNVTLMRFSPDSTKIIVIYQGNHNQHEIIDLRTRKTLLKKCKVYHMVFSPDSTKVKIMSGNNQIIKFEIINLLAGNILTIYNVYRTKFSPDSKKIWVEYNKKRKVIDLLTQQVLFKRNVGFLEFSPDSTKIRIAYYGDYTQEKIIDLLTGNTLTTKAHVQTMEFSPDSTKIIVLYNNNEEKMEIVDLNHNYNINFATYTPQQLLFIFNINQDPYYIFKIGIDKSTQIWQSFNTATQKILQENYWTGAAHFYWLNLKTIKDMIASI